MSDEFDEAFEEFANKQDGVEDHEEDNDVEEEVVAEEDIVDEIDGVEDEGEDDVDSAELLAQIETLKKLNSDLEHKSQSNDGRVSALQLKINDLEKAHKESPGQVVESDPGWNEFVEEDEFAAKRIEGRLKQESDKLREDLLAEFDSKLNPFRAADQQRYTHEQQSILDDAFPGWHDLVNSTEFKGWIGEQPEPVQKMLNSNDAVDYKYLINSYGNTTDTTNANELKQKRKTALASNETIPRRNSGKVTAGAPEDFDGAFDYYAEKARKERARGY